MLFNRTPKNSGFFWIFAQAILQANQPVWHIYTYVFLHRVTNENFLWWSGIASILFWRTETLTR